MLKRPLHLAPKVQTHGLRSFFHLPKSQKTGLRYHENIVLIKKKKKKVVGRVKLFLEMPLSHPQAFLCNIKATHMVIKG